MSGVLSAVTIVAALGCALIAGVFFAFSTFIMRALARLKPPVGVAAMQSINVVALTPPLMIPLFGTALACLASIVAAVANWGEAFAPWLLAGGVLYLAGVIVVTMAYNVPRNNELVRLEPGSAGAAARWPGWASEWTAGNHVRSVAGLAAAGALAVALSVA